MKHSFLDFLINKGLIDHDISAKILIDAKETNLGLIASTARLSGLSETRIARNVAEFYGLPRFNYNHFRVDQLATELISGIVSVRVGCLPYAFGPKEELHVVCYDPELTRGIMDEVDRLIRGPIFLEVGPMSAVRELAAFVHYGRSFSDSFGEQVCSIARDEETGRHSPVPREGGIDIPPKETSDEIDLSKLEESFEPEIPLPSEEDIDKKIKHIAELNEGSTAFEWDDEDTVVRKIAVRDESLKNFFYRTITSRMEAPDVVARRRVLLEPTRGEARSAGRRAVPPPPPRPSRNAMHTPIQYNALVPPLATSPAPNSSNDFHRHSWENKTPSRAVDAVKEAQQADDSELLVQLVRHASRIEDLERQVAELTTQVERLQSSLRTVKRSLELSNIKIIEDDIGS